MTGVPSGAVLPAGSRARRSALPAWVLLAPVCPGEVGDGGAGPAVDRLAGQRGAGARVLVQQGGEPGRGVRVVAGGDAGPEPLVLGEGGEDVGGEVLGEPQRPGQQRGHHRRVDRGGAVLVAALVRGKVVAQPLGLPRRHGEAVGGRQVRRHPPQHADRVQRQPAGAARHREACHVQGPLAMADGVDVSQAGDAPGGEPGRVAAPVLGGAGDGGGAGLPGAAGGRAFQQRVGGGQVDQRPSGALEAGAQRDREQVPVDPAGRLMLAPRQRRQVPGRVAVPGQVSRAGAVGQSVRADERGAGRDMPSPVADSGEGERGGGHGLYLPLSSPAISSRSSSLAARAAACRSAAAVLSSSRLVSRRK